MNEDLAIDLGTCSTRIFGRNRGLCVDEPSVVASGKKALDVAGHSAQSRVGHPSTEVVYPISNGWVADECAVSQMLKAFFRQFEPKGPKWLNGFRLRPQMVVGICPQAFPVQQRALCRSLFQAGARRVFLMDSATAALVGLGIDVHQPKGHMVVDIGASGTRIAVVSMGCVVASESLPLGGQAMDRTLVAHLRRTHALSIGLKTAEDIKIRLGAAIQHSSEYTAEVRGRDLAGQAKTIVLSTDDVAQALRETIGGIVQGLFSVIEKTPPEMAEGIFEQGVFLVGGGSQLRHLGQALHWATQLKINRVEEPARAGILGMGEVLAQLPRFSPFLLSSDRFA